jgi:acyl-CoA reductase-like NAD-dependent aldehyde dehydrogenase
MTAVAARTMDVLSPYSGDVVGTVPVADVARTLDAAAAAAPTVAALPSHARADALHRAAARIAADEDELAATITAEQGKHTAEARAEASRIAGIVRLCAE